MFSYIPIGGTWANDAVLDKPWEWFCGLPAPSTPLGWHQKGSEVERMMFASDFLSITDTLPLWSGAIGGWKNHQPWKAGARNIYEWIRDMKLRPEELNFIGQTIKPIGIAGCKFIFF